jgi:hypothetical protein
VSTSANDPQRTSCASLKVEDLARKVETFGLRNLTRLDARPCAARVAIWNMFL